MEIVRNFATARTNHHSHVTERLMFLPTGEVFKDEQNSSYYHSDFLFSGKELDAETGNYYYGARYYAPRIGIWLSPDPMQLKYPHVSSYAYCMGNPVNRIDLHGDSIFYYMPKIQHGLTIGYSKYTYGKYGDTYGFGGEEGELFFGSSKTISLFSEGLNRIRMGGPAGSELVSYLSGSTSMNVSLAYNGENMTEISLSYNGKNTLKVFWDPENQIGGIDAFGGIIRPPYIGLAHELAHAYDVIKNGYVNETLWFTDTKGNKILKNEIFACQMENLIRSENSLPIRKYYGGIGIIPSIHKSSYTNFNHSTLYYNK